jgi:protein involved in polysaccharide export with SLBB domain
MIRLSRTFRDQLSFLLVFIFIFFQNNMNIRFLYADESSNEPPQTQRENRYVSKAFFPGNAVEISVYPDTTSFLHGTFPIDGEGFIYLPIKGKVKIVDMSTAEFGAYLTKNFRQYIKTPDVLIRPLIRVSLLGGFNSPGMFYVHEDLTLWQLVQKAGGTAHENGLREMKWERDKKLLESNLISYIESGKSIKNLGFRTGDQLWTPTPGQPGVLERVSTVLPFITVAISAYTLYLTYALISQGR